jgi:hypothetical protein
MQMLRSKSVALRHSSTLAPRTSILSTLNGVMAAAALFILISSVSALPAAAQNRQSRTNTASTELTITANIVSVLWSRESPQAATIDKAAVLYSVPTTPDNTESKQETRAIPIAIGNGKETAILKTTTFVER